MGQQSWPTAMMLRGLIQRRSNIGKWGVLMVCTVPVAGTATDSEEPWPNYERGHSFNSKSMQHTNPCNTISVGREFDRMDPSTTSIAVLGTNSVERQTFTPRRRGRFFIQSLDIGREDTGLWNQIVFIYLL
jgi:hypothetical protein